MGIILIPFFAILGTIIGIYVWLVIANVIMSWLISFNVVQTNNNFVIMVSEFLYKVTEPVLGEIRRFIPIVGGFDFSPLVLILILWFLQGVLLQLRLKLTLVGGV